MSLLPLYDEIISRMDGTEKELDKDHCSTITKLDQNHLNIIYLLILHHYIQNTQSNVTKIDLPYNSRTISNGKGIIFRHLGYIPVDLQKIIFRYLTIVCSNSS